MGNDQINEKEKQPPFFFPCLCGIGPIHGNIVFSKSQLGENHGTTNCHVLVYEVSNHLLTHLLEEGKITKDKHDEIINDQTSYFLNKPNKAMLVGVDNVLNKQKGP
jgi:hypothetical protein